MDGYEGYVFAADGAVTKLFLLERHTGRSLQFHPTWSFHDKRVTELIKRYLKAKVMENGLLVKTEEGSPQEARWEGRSGA